MRFRLGRVLRLAVERGFPAAGIGYRWVPTESVQSTLSRCSAKDSDGRPRYETIHPESVSSNPLPRNVTSRDSLPADPGWWHYSFHDVPERRNGETFRATIPNCRIVPCKEPGRDQFWVTLLNQAGRALDIREMAYREWQAPVMRKRPRHHRAKATWICERVFHNHSHWLSAHLPKLLLLRERNELSQLVLPEKRMGAIDECMRMYGMEPNRFDTIRTGEPMQVDELTILGTDRFRPELLRLVGAYCPIPAASMPHRKVLISREGATRRRLLNEDAIWNILKSQGFERVRMEDLNFTAQVSLMRETAVLFAPHGAGLTNMLFCPPGAKVVELADLGFPNPNFYATAAAMGHSYWLLEAESRGTGHLLERDLYIDPEKVGALDLSIHQNFQAAG